ncbi:MAG: hypothetical protein KDK89_16225 [Alphaproteobacteria bacterium]|nr:hypothetical protein [Alphaproteobacteria bacterium]
MTHFHQYRMIAAAAGLAAVSGLAMFSQTASASASNVLSCEGSDRRSVVECCQTLLLKKGPPLWMRQTAKNCTTVTVRCSRASYRAAGVTGRYCRMVAQSEVSSDSHQIGGGPATGGGHGGRGASGGKR